MNKYVAIFNGIRETIEADTPYDAKKKAVTQMRVPLSKMGLLSITLVEVGGAAVIHNPASL